MSDASTTAGDLSDLVRNRIANLRPKLLDLTRRNPLISTRLSARSNSLVRVVDELPEIIRFNLGHGMSMRFAPLPPLEDDPKDELSEDFLDALSGARINDEEYQQAIDALDPHLDESLDVARQLERELKDRVRVALGMPPRQKKADLSLQEHARINGITPNWELPLSDEQHEDGRHDDDLIQTLMLPDDLERRLNALTAKCRTWQQETGINVLHAAFGFLEWKEPNASNPSFSPLVLHPVTIEKRKTRQGTEFWVSAEGDDTETNFVLAEKMRLEFGMNLPPYNGGSVEEYFAEFAENAPSALQCKIRRQVVFGVFPSARMAMYRDLDIAQQNIEEDDVLSALFGGTDQSGATPFADEYDVDEPSIEAKAPYLVLDADSSQFSTIVDVVDGKNLAVEGPPGTGKSQTIVNTIANALGQGKKVLFVAEKMAALDVVKSRLEAVGLGEFILPLQAERSSRQQVIASVRNRMEMRSVSSPKDYEKRIEQFRQTRSELAAYIDVISANFGDTGMTIHDVLGKSIATGDRLERMPRGLQNPQIDDVEKLTVIDIEKILEKAQTLTDASNAASRTAKYWKGLTTLNIDRFAANDLAELAIDASSAFAQTASARDLMEEYGLNAALNTNELCQIKQILDNITPLIEKIDRQLTIRLTNDDLHLSILEFLDTCAEFQDEKSLLLGILDYSDEKNLASSLYRLHDLCRERNTKNLDASDWDSEFSKQEEYLETLNESLNKLSKFVEFFPEARDIDIESLERASEIVRGANQKALLVRSAVTAEPSASTIIEEMCKNGRDLNKEKKRIEIEFSTKTDISPKKLKRYSEVIANSGALSWISSEFREAKRIYLSLSKTHEFNKSKSSSYLRNLAEWKEEVASYNDNPQMKIIFGLNHKGIDTDFSIFDELIKYYRHIDNTLPGPEHRQIRSLLKSGDLDLITSIPDISAPDNRMIYTDLEAAIGASQSEIAESRAFISQAAPLLKIFREPEKVSPNQISKLAERFERNKAIGNDLDSNETIKSELGERFMGAATKREDFEKEIEVVEMLADAGELEVTVCSLIDRSVVYEAASAIGDVLALDQRATDALANLTAKSGPAIAAAIADVPPRSAADYLDEASHDQEGMFTNSNFANALREMEECGFLWAFKEFDTNDIPNSDFPDTLEAIIYQAMARRTFEVHGSVLTRFPGSKLDELRSNLAKFDNKIIRLTRQHLRSSIQEAAHPPTGNSKGKRSSFTNRALLENEIAKKQRFVPVRDLTRRAGDALLELKPCWMMSPLAVAQYLPATTKFDLCIIDEASQMPPEDAVGALFRANQAMVVGDTNQLPPTSFFRKMIEDEDVDEDEQVLEESVLEMANSVFRPARRLRWHYRSKHSGLIQFSNEHVYENSLIVFPSPIEDHPDMGVSLVSVDGLYKSGTNGLEAKAMIDAALRFIRTTPNRSLGLVTLNQKQRDLLLEEWDRAVNRDAAASQYVEYWNEHNDGLEQFFIKNLENVQGDERDVIFIGTVYGPERSDGPVLNRFGPIAGIAGRRRLNVLFSRAKEQIVTFSSMTSEDIRSDEHGNPGAFMLKRWLEYSATGRVHSGDTTGAEPDSDFEQYVIDQLHSMGCKPVPQVGVAGFRIDIGVMHPQWPHGFIMGVECDGATYHSTKSARDRDRLREKVLTDLGWNLHRIWSTDWFNDPRKEVERLRAAVEIRLNELDQSPYVRPSVNIFDTPLIQNINEDNKSPTYVSPGANSPFNISKPESLTENSSSKNMDIVEIGDTVHVRYLGGDQSSRSVTLSDADNDPDAGIVNVTSPLGRALLGAEIEEDFEILIGNTVRPATVEKIIKADRNQETSVDLHAETVDPKPISTRKDTAIDASSLRAEQFYNPDYLEILRPYACAIVDSSGPVTFRHLSELIARAHGFQRTGSQIKRQVWAAVAKVRNYSNSPNGEKVFWPQGLKPAPVVEYRGMTANGLKREWRDLPHPEKLGLAIEIVRTRQSVDQAEAMAARIGLGRLRQSTRQEFNALLAEAQSYRESNR